MLKKLLTVIKKEIVYIVGTAAVFIFTHLSHKYYRNEQYSCSDILGFCGDLCMIVMLIWRYKKG